MKTEEIFNYLKVNDDLITGGQPSEAQLRAAAAEGFTTVINLATYEPPRSLADEAGLVTALGMAYYNIPVVWTNPTRGDFESFERLLSQQSGEKILLHCIANFRVTAFYALYAMKHLGWSEAQAEGFRQSVWQGRDDPVWERFIREMKALIAS